MKIVEFLTLKRHPFILISFIFNYRSVSVLYRTTIVVEIILLTWPVGRVFRYLMMLQRLYYVQ